MTQVLKLYQVDAFTNKLFSGNPAAVIPLISWLKDDVLQNIAMENNLSETAFFVPLDDGSFQLRWFTPVSEVGLCGHATLAVAHVLWHHLKNTQDTLVFHSLRGTLTVEKTQKGLCLDFPATMPTVIPEKDIPSDLLLGLKDKNGQSVAVKEVLETEDWIVVLQSERDVATLQPEFSLWQQLKNRGVLVTASSEAMDIDFVSRCFFPRQGVNEDPVTGSAHCDLVPYWVSKKQKNHLIAKQLSSRQGILKCELVGNRVRLTGQAVTYLIGEIAIN